MTGWRKMLVPRIEIPETITSEDEKSA